MSRSRADLDFFDQFLHHLPIAFDLNFDFAAVEIANPSGKSQPGCVKEDEIAEANPLHNPLHDNMHTDLHCSGKKYLF